MDNPSDRAAYRSFWGLVLRNANLLGPGASPFFPLLADDWHSRRLFIPTTLAAVCSLTFLCSRSCSDLSAGCAYFRPLRQRRRRIIINSLPLYIPPLLSSVRPAMSASRTFSASFARLASVACPRTQRVSAAQSVSRTISSRSASWQTRSADIRARLQPSSVRSFTTTLPRRHGHIEPPKPGEE